MELETGPTAMIYAGFVGSREFWSAQTGTTDQRFDERVNFNPFISNEIGEHLF